MVKFLKISMWVYNLKVILSEEVHHKVNQNTQLITTLNSLII